MKSQSTTRRPPRGRPSAPPPPRGFSRARGSARRARVEEARGGARGCADPPAASSPVVPARKTARVSDARDFTTPPAPPTTRAAAPSPRPRVRTRHAPSPRFFSFSPFADLDVLEAGFRCGGIGGARPRARRSPRRHGLRITTPAAWDRRHRPAPSRARGRCGACQTTSGICIDNSANRHNSSSLSLNHTKIMRVV